MKLPWFKRIGIFYLPVTLVGWILFSISVVYALYVFISINNISHSVSDLMINFVFSLLIIGAVYSLIAFLTSRTRGRKIF
jgi:hypothetical protein